MERLLFLRVSMGDRVSKGDSVGTGNTAVSAFIERWSKSGGAERANYQLFLAELCDVLGVPRPDPTWSNYACIGLPNWPLSSPDFVGFAQCNRVQWYRSDVTGHPVNGPRVAVSHFHKAAYGIFNCPKLRLMKRFAIDDSTVCGIIQTQETYV